MDRNPQPYWHPFVAGVALGLTLLATFLITGHGLGASGFFTRLTVAVAEWLAPAWAAANTYFAPYLKGDISPLLSWISWEAVGMLIGAAAGAITSGRFRLMTEGGEGLASGSRLGYAFVGGILVGFGARLARGCTSGLGLSGGATLAVAGFVFLIAFFAAGFLTMRLVRGAWR